MSFQKLVTRLQKWRQRLFSFVLRISPSHRLVVLDGIKQGTYSVKQYIQYHCGHMSRLDSKDEDKCAWLLRGLNNQDFRAVCMVTYGLEGDKASVLSLSQYNLTLDRVADSGRTKPVGGSGHGASVQGKGKGKVAGLGIQGGIQKSKPKPKPAHAEDLSFKARQTLMREGKCFACKQKGHNQTNAAACPMHPRHADAMAGRGKQTQGSNKARTGVVVTPEHNGAGSQRQNCWKCFSRWLLERAIRTRVLGAHDLEFVSNSGNH